jgi:hypothetical protein
VIERSKRIGCAVAWAGLITGAEWRARKLLRSRANAWIVAYSPLAALALARGARPGARRGWFSFGGVALAVVGYPLGRRVLGDRPSVEPPGGLLHELAALEIVAVTEELTWGAIVEPLLGATATALLFSGKHVIIDGRWRRSLGLFLFWLGLSRQRRRWPLAAFVLHLALNGFGVVRGHQSRQDQF